ncbi:hypothetical protein LJ737_17610 [Hymenobacter sp. 15J16-1T3B]|uniref:hypothetical protein n=1 Tax=Hymenobacter sp. 15J16-1T3B TaxID=2886941 RepID=UPI001D0FD9D0|nr:hypothetical protein [Hymenobacter sp. 15J16-1T3B]MCC3159064.1 hypothetical protein [Hymenobacter sp. 15J16-1T3B]
MKLFPLALAALLPLAGLAQATAQVTAPAPPRQALKLGIYSNETAGISYERKLGPRYSLQATAGYWTAAQRGARSFGLDSTSGLAVLQDQFQRRSQRAALQVQVRRYLQAQKPALIGWYAGVGAQLRGHWTRYRYDAGRTERAFRHEQALQLRIGRQWQLGPRLTFDANFGPELDLGTEPHYTFTAAGVYAPTADRFFFARLGAGLALQVGYRL